MNLEMKNDQMKTQNLISTFFLEIIFYFFKKNIIFYVNKNF